MRSQAECAACVLWLMWHSTCASSSIQHRLYHHSIDLFAFLSSLLGLQAIQLPGNARDANWAICVLGKRAEVIERSHCSNIKLAAEAAAGQHSWCCSSAAAAPP